MKNYPNEIIEKLNNIKNQFTELFESGNAWQTEWTKLLKRTITKIGQDKDFFVNTGGIKEADDGEWLFDIVWSELKYNGEKTTIIDIPLVVESEISRVSFGGFKEDFDKLFFSPQSTKLFITRINRNEPNLLNECLEYAQESVNNNINLNIENGVYIITWLEEKGFKLDYISSEN